MALRSVLPAPEPDSPAALTIDGLLVAAVELQEPRWRCSFARLASRLGITADRLQVICTSASFSDAERASRFAADLTGTDHGSFDTITGELALRPGASAGSEQEARLLADLDVEKFYDMTTRPRGGDAVAGGMSDARPTA